MMVLDAHEDHRKYIFANKADFHPAQPRPGAEVGILPAITSWDCRSWRGLTRVGKAVGVTGVIVSGADPVQAWFQTRHNSAPCPYPH